MKHLIIILAAATALVISSCTGQYDDIDKFSGEIVYPSAFDTIYARYGFERVELDLWQAGRISSAQMKFGKAKRTIVEYDGVKHPIDSICSWVNVTGLTSNKLYRIKVYTEDEFENASVPQEIAVIPFTSFDLSLIEMAPPRLSSTSNSIVVKWPNNSLNSVQTKFCGLQAEYKDVNDNVQKVSVAKDDDGFTALDLTPSSKVPIAIDFKVVPAMSDGTFIMDTCVVSQTMEVQLPSSSTIIQMNEAAAIRANGITDFSMGALSQVTELTLPQHLSTFADLFYLTGLKKLDLTGKDLKCLPVLDYNRNSMFTSCGGGAWQPFMRRVEKTADINIQGIDVLQDALALGTIEEVIYIPESLGKAVDEALAPYVETGVVTLVQDDDPLFPQEVYIEPQFYVNGTPVDGNWAMDNWYSGDFLPRQGYTDVKGHFDPTNETVNGDAIDLHLDQLTESQRDGKNIYKCVIKMRSASFAMNLPKEYMYDSRRYTKLRFKMFCGSSAEVMDAAKSFLAPWIRPMNYMWNFSGNSNYNQENWDVTLDNISTDDIRTNWKEYTVDMGANDGWKNDNSGNRRNRAIVFNIGHEPGEFNYDAAKEVVLYVADIRMCKN